MQSKINKTKSVMKRIIFLWVLTMYLSGNVFSQGFFIKNSNIEKWYVENNKLANEVKKVLNLPEFYAVTKGKVSVEELLPSFHFVDFDNNGTLDLLFNGKIYNVFYVYVFYKKNDGYLVSIGEKGSIVSANLPNEDYGLNLSIWKEGCCGDFINSFTQYACITTNNTSYFNVTNKSLAYRRTVLPSVRIDKPVSFKVTAVTNVRSEPFVDDEKTIGGKNSWKGNSIGMYPPNATGTIYAETRDNKNEFWYFVRMNNETGIYIHSNRFTADDDDKGNENFPIYGLIHSKDVKMDNE